MRMQKNFTTRLLQLFKGKQYNRVVNKELANRRVIISCDERLIKGGDDAVSAAIRKLDSIQVPPDVARKLGLSENWKDNISPEFVERVAKTASKNADALKELSKY